MQFSNTTNKDGIIQTCEVILGMTDADISGDATLLKQFTGLINTWYRRVNSWIWEVTGTWEYDDSNWTNLPIATATLVDEQENYQLPSTAQRIERVEVMDSQGTYQRLRPFDKSELKTISTSEKAKPAGMPTRYDLAGESLFLYPKPGASYVTLAKGLKLYFSRDIDEFASSDTTAQPGFINNFHKILPLGACLDYCISFLSDDVNKINNIRAEINALRQELKTFYLGRHKDMPTRISPSRRNYK